MENNNKVPLGQIIALILLVLSFGMVAYGVLSLDSIHILNNKSNKNENYTSDNATSNEEKSMSYPEKLKQISNKFNELKSVKEYTDAGTMTIKSTVNDTELLITVISDKSYEFTFNLSDNILYKSVGQEEAFFYTFYGIYVATAKAVIDGYDETTAMNTISDASQTMTLAENGIEMIQTADGGLTFRLDISKSLNLPDNSSRYVTTSDLQKFDEFIGKMGTVNAKAGNIAYYYKYEPKEDEEALILIAEPNNQTELSYKSLVTFIEYLYGAEEATSFQNKYPQLANKTIAKYEITLNPVNAEYDTYYNDNYKLIEMVIKK